MKLGASGAGLLRRNVTGEVLIVAGILLAMILVAAGVGAYTRSQPLVTLFFVLGSFVVIFGYFWISEAIWSGQTLGKKAFRLRAAGDQGEPLTFAQAGIRNIVRIVDFLPYGYGIGLIVLFANGKGKRLGDLAAGTKVERVERFGVGDPQAFVVGRAGDIAREVLQVVAGERELGEDHEARTCALRAADPLFVHRDVPLEGAEGRGALRDRDPDGQTSARSFSRRSAYSCARLHARASSLASA